MKDNNINGNYRLESVDVEWLWSNFCGDFYSWLFIFTFSHARHRRCSLKWFVVLNWEEYGSGRGLYCFSLCTFGEKAAETLPSSQPPFLRSITHRIPDN